MTDLTKGIIEIEEMVLSRNSQASDFNNLVNPNIDVQTSKRGHTYAKFLNPIIANDVAMHVEISLYADSDIPEIKLFPSVPAELKGKYDEVAKYKLKASKQFLKAVIDDKADEDAESICYSYKWGYIIALVSEDRDYGLRGGEITIRFRED